MACFGRAEACYEHLGECFRFICMREKHVGRSCFTLFFLFPLGILHLGRTFRGLASLLGQRFSEALFLRYMLHMRIQRLGLCPRRGFSGRDLPIPMCFIPSIQFQCGLYH